MVGGLTAPEVGGAGDVGLIGMPPTVGACGVVDGGIAGLLLLSPGGVCSGSAPDRPLVGGAVVGVPGGIADVVPTAVVFSGVDGMVAAGDGPGATLPALGGAASVVDAGVVAAFVDDVDGGGVVVLPTVDGVDGGVVVEVEVEVDGVPPAPGDSWLMVGLRSVGTSGRGLGADDEVVPCMRTRSPRGIPCSSGRDAARGSASTDSEAAASAIR